MSAPQPASVMLSAADAWDISPETAARVLAALRDLPANPDGDSSEGAEAA